MRLDLLWERWVIGLPGNAFAVPFSLDLAKSRITARDRVPVACALVDAVNYELRPVGTFTHAIVNDLNQH